MQSHSFYSHLIDTVPFSDQLKKESHRNDADCWANVIAKGLCSESDLLNYYIRYKNEVLYKIDTLTIDQEFKVSCLEKCQGIESAIPLYQTEKLCCIAVANPFSNDIKIIERSLKKNVEIKLVPPSDIIRFKDNHEENTEDLLTKILKMAIKKGASDIHLLNSQKKLKIWVRVDGGILELICLQNEEATLLKKLIKLKANLDISEQSLPQDGQLDITINDKNWDIRVSTLPTYFDEDIVLRIFNSVSKIEKLQSLGFPHNITHKIQSICHMTSGLFLVTGPTGSGKTSTLYACLNECQAQHKRVVVSLEDPIERQLPNVRQSQVNSKSNYTFVRGLKAILRQDPDIIMIGEIRDAETAKIALEAAYTGHLVLSTLHTSDVQSSWRRLLHFGCDPFLLSYCVRGILSQTLQAQICKVCKGCGCSDCQFKGISGRKPKAELLSMLENTKVYDLKNTHELIQDHHLLSNCHMGLITD
jgi:general secretion pathway protein E